MKIPSNNQWTQVNNGDLLGVLHETENVNLDKEGVVTLSKKVFSRVDSDDDANLSQPIAIVYYGGQYIIVTIDNAFKFDLGGSTTQEITLTSDMNFNSDAIVCYNRVYLTTDDNLDYYDGSLNAGNKVLTTSVPHPMEVFDSQVTYKLAVGNVNTVLLLDSSHSTGATLTLPVEYQVTTLAYRNGYLYVGTKHLNGGEAKIFVWDGATGSADFEIPTGASEIYSLKPYKQTVAGVSNIGQVFIISGNAIQQIAAFPIYYNQYAVWDNTAYLSAPPKVLNRGMVTVGDDIYLNVDGTVDSGFIPEMKHGLWVFDAQKQSLYHRAHSSSDASVVEAASALSSDTLTLSTHNLKTGDLVIVRGVGSLTGLNTGKRYYAKVESATTIKLAQTRKALQAGNYVTIGGSVSGSNFSYTPSTNYSSYQNVFSGPLIAINPVEPFFLGWETPVIWASRLQDIDENIYYGVQGFTEGWNIGRATTQRIYSPNITETWKTLHNYFEGLNLDNEEIIVKVKTSAKHGYPSPIFKGVWASSTQINSVAGTTDDYEWNDIEDGDEVTIVDGYGAGYTVHVSGSPSLPASTWQMTVDESIGTLNGDVYFYVDKFKKLQSIDNSRNDQDLFEVLIDAKSAWIQLKIEMRGYEIEFSLFDLIHGINK